MMIQMILYKCRNQASKQYGESMYTVLMAWFSDFTVLLHGAGRLSEKLSSVFKQKIREN